MIVFSFCGFSATGYAQDANAELKGNSRYQYYADSLRLDFNALRRQDVNEFTGILLQLEGSDHSLKEILLNWNKVTESAKILIVNGQDIRTFGIDSLDWPANPASIKVSIALDFHKNLAKVSLSDHSVVIKDAGLSLNIGYKVSLLPKLSLRPDPNIPPMVEYENLTVSAPSPDNHHRVWIWLVGIILADLVISFFLTIGKKRKKARNEVGPGTISRPKTDSFTIPEFPKSSSIRLFGGFCVYDSEGEDITRSFSPMLRELLTLMVIYSAGKGITSTQLKDILWPDKDLKSARNNRAVYIGKLRSLLDKVGEYALEIDSGYWKFTPKNIFVDYLQLQACKDGQPTYENAEKVMMIVQGGPLLVDMDSPWLDSFKAESADSVLECLGAFVEDPNCEKKLDFALALSDTIFRFDDLNEKALHLKCRAYALSGRHSSAKTTYDLFVQKYKEIYGTTFQYGFTQLLNTPPDAL